MEIAIYEKMPDPLAAIERLGTIIARSGMFGCTQSEQGMVFAMECLAARRSPIQLLREYHLIEGRLSDRADSMLAKFRAAGGKHDVLQRDEHGARVRLTLGPTSMEFGVTWDELKNEPFVMGKDGLKKNYRTPRARMQTMWSRAISDGVRTLAPEIVAGIQTPEEIIDDETTRPQGPGLDLKQAQTAPPSAPAPAPSSSPAQTTTHQQQSSASPAPKPAAPAPVTVDVQATVVQSSPPAAPAQASTQASTAVTTPSGELDDATVEKLEALIGEHAIKAVNFMLKQDPPMLKPGQSLQHLSPKNAQRILKQSAGFLRAIQAA